MTAGEIFQQSLHATQIDEDASLPFSFLSQPPDIRNWFSSYEYESPDTPHVSDILEDVSKDLLNDSVEEDPLPNKGEKEEENGNPWFSEERSQNEYSLKLDLPPEGRRDLTFNEEFTVKSSSSVKTICTDTRPSELCLAQKNEICPIIKKETNESLNNIRNQNGILQYEEAFPKHGTSQFKGNQNSKLLGGISNEEQKENVEMIAENGFISTRNRDGGKKHEENSKGKCLIMNGKRSRLELQEGNSVLEKERTFSVRRVLAEKTNICFAEEAIKAEAPGKWQCPRKSKPYAGPPLKQLRLERWVRRVL